MQLLFSQSLQPIKKSTL